LALNATLILQSRKSERRVPASSFFKGLYETDIRPGEILVAAEFPKVDSSAFPLDSVCEAPRLDQDDSRDSRRPRRVGGVD
jgi:xanthine dehydrogenase iron-sulfur cluster and FAD-binding subunit A